MAKLCNLRTLVCLSMLAPALSFGTESFAGRVTLRVVPDAKACTGAQMAPLLLALAPILIKQGLDFLKEMAAEKAASYEATVSATAADSFLINCNTPAEPNKKLHVDGLAFGYGPVSGTPMAGLSEKYTALGFTAQPKIYLEGDFLRDDDNNYVRFVPTTLEYNDTLAKSGTEKDLLVTLSFNFPSAYLESKRSSNPADDATTSNAKDRADPATETNTAKSAKTKAVSAKSKTAASNEEKTTSTGDANGSKNSATAAAAGSTESVVLPLFEHMSKGRKINLKTVTSGWFSLPDERENLVVKNLKTTLPVTVNLVIKETDAGKGAAVWLAVSDAISKNSSTIASAILGKSQSTNAKAASTAGGTSQ